MRIPAARLRVRVTSRAGAWRLSAPFEARDSAFVSGNVFGQAEHSCREPVEIQLRGRSQAGNLVPKPVHLPCQPVDPFCHPADLFRQPVQVGSRFPTCGPEAFQPTRLTFRAVP
jgi:hypothetical protein